MNQFTSVLAGICGEYQITIEQGIHVDVFKAKIWNIRTGYNEETSINLYDRDLLNLCCVIVEKIYRLTDPMFQNMEILWLDSFAQ